MYLRYTSQAILLKPKTDSEVIVSKIQDTCLHTPACSDKMASVLQMIFHRPKTYHLNPICTFLEHSRNFFTGYKWSEEAETLSFGIHNEKCSNIIRSVCFKTVWSLKSFLETSVCFKHNSKLHYRYKSVNYFINGHFLSSFCCSCRH